MDAIVIGAGHAGLSMSRCLSDSGIEHLVLERGRVGERWRSESWESLRLLTPNSFIRMPGKVYGGDEPDGFFSVSEWVKFLEEYAYSFNAPVKNGVNVELITASKGGFQVSSGLYCWYTRALVIATGYCSEPSIPRFAEYLPPRIVQLPPSCYRRPDQLPAGGVMVVGCGASGVQIAEELARSGRRVLLSVGRHRRLPRVYRGHDILWWSEKIGLFRQRTDPKKIADIQAPQLVGSDEKRSIDLGILQDMGVRLAGHLMRVDGSKVYFASDLENTIAAAEADMFSMLQKIDEYACLHGMGGDILIPPPIYPANPASVIDLYKDDIHSVIWATGYRRSYPWLQLDIFNANGELDHTAGITKEPGVYVLGLRRQIRYNSNFIDGAGEDAREVADHLVNYLLR